MWVPPLYVGPNLKMWDLDHYMKKKWYLNIYFVTTFEQPSLSYLHYDIFSLHCFWPIRREKKKVVTKSCNKWLYKYHYSIWKYSFILPCYDELTPCLTCRSRIFKHFAIICIVFGGLWTTRLLIPGWPKVYHVLGTWARTRAEAESSNISVTRFRTTIIR